MTGTLFFNKNLLRSWVYLIHTKNNLRKQKKKQKTLECYSNIQISIIILVSSVTLSSTKIKVLNGVQESKLIW